MRLRTIAAGLLALLLTWPASAALAGGIKPSQWGISGYYQAGATLAPKNIKGAGVMVHAAWSLLQRPKMELRLRLEASAGTFWDYETASEVALVPALRVLVNLGAWQPYVEGGVGGSYSNFQRRDLGSDLNFLLFAGVGVRWRISPSLALEAGYRYRHLSNANLGTSNPGLNTHQFLVGLVLPF